MTHDVITKNLNLGDCVQDQEAFRKRSWNIERDWLNAGENRFNKLLPRR